MRGAFEAVLERLWRMKFVDANVHGLPFCLSELTALRDDILAVAADEV